LVGKPEGKEPLGRRRHRWEGKVGMELREIGWETVDWMHLIQGRDQWRAVVNTILNLGIPKQAGNFLTS
jgi:hypothetical protein